VQEPGWLEDGTLRFLDGAEVPLAGVQDVRQWAALGEGYVAAGTRRGQDVVSFHDARGALETTWPVQPSGSLVVDGDGRHAAWVLPSREVALLDGSTGEARLLGPVRGGDLVPRGIVGGCPADCGVVVTGRGGAGLGTTYLAAVDGTVAPYLTEVPVVLAPAPDYSLVAGLDRVAPDDVHSCGGVWTTGTAGSLWEDCVDNVYVFAPDARHVATTFAEGLGPRELRLKDARTGELRHEIAIAEGVAGIWWEDAAHVLVGVQRGEQWSVVRVGVDGSEETVAGPAPGVPSPDGLPRSPYTLPTGP